MLVYNPLKDELESKQYSVFCIKISAMKTDVDFLME